MRLRTLGEPLTDELITALEACNIKTDTDLILSGIPTDIWLKLPPDTISLKDLTTVIESVTEILSAPSYTGIELLQCEEKRRDKLASVPLRSGVQVLDDLVGGFGYQQLLEISGAQGSGKTALALQIVLRQLSQYPNSSVVWIDTTGDISPDRISSALESFSSEADSHTALQRLQITRAFDMDAMQESLEEIRTTASMILGQPVLRTVVIDSVTPIFRPLLNAVTSQGHATMVSFMRQLREYANTFTITFLVLNGTSVSTHNNPSSAFASTVRKPALGPSFMYESDATLWLAQWSRGLGYEVPEERQDDDEVYVAEMFRTKCTQSRAWCTFKMRNGILI